MLTRLGLLVLTLWLIVINSSVYGQYASTFPDPIPLIHKSPYFNAWIGADGNATTPENRWPVFFSGPVSSLSIFRITLLYPYHSSSAG